LEENQNPGRLHHVTAEEMLQARVQHGIEDVPSWDVGRKADERV